MRTLQEIDQDYVNACAEIGHLTLQLEQLPEKIRFLKAKVVQLIEESQLVKKSQEPRID